MSTRIAVIDLGKTNKKVVVIDDALAPVASRTASFPAERDADGILVEPVDRIEAWLIGALAELARAPGYHAIAVSAHGATWVGLDADHRRALPVIAYDQPLDTAAQAELDADFRRLTGDPLALQDETGTCDLPLLINPAKGVLWAQRRLPAAWARVRRVIWYPEWWSFRLTGALAAEPTYAMNHAYLYDIRTQRPSTAARALGVAEMLDCDFKPPWHAVGTVRDELRRQGVPAVPVTLGVHDSNASLLPYLVQNPQRDFVLNSTGTWCVAMHGVDRVEYRPGELGQQIIFNRNCFGGLNKVSILLGGMDYALYHGLIGGDHAALDLARLDAALARHGDLILPGAHAGQFPRHRGGARAGDATFSVDDLRAGRTPAWFADHGIAHDLLNASIALQSMVALERTGLGPRTAVFVEGGFRNNPAFLALTAALFPSRTVARTDMPEATASGAALLGLAMLAGTTPRAFADCVRIAEESVAAPALPHLAAYCEAWLAACA